MTLSAALSTPRPLSQKRDSGEKRVALNLAGADAANAANVNVNSSGLPPAKAIQKNEAPLARRKPVQTKERQSAGRLANLSHLDALRTDIRLLIDAVVLSADVELLDLMRDEVGSFRRHKAAQDARTWASAAGVTLETGLMQLDRALRPTSTGDQS